MRLRVWLSISIPSVLLTALALSCGATNSEAPRTPTTPASEQCKSFAELMPNFEQAISTGQTEGLKTVVEEYLLAPTRAGQPPPANDVLRALFDILAGYAKLPAEPGAPSGEYCANPPPPLDQSHPLCDMRRSLDLMVHTQDGIDTLHMVDPVLAGAMDYLTGKEPSSAVPHYEVAGVISAMCRQSVACQMSDTMDLLIGISAFGQTPEGKKAIDDLVQLAASPSLSPYLSDNAQTYGGEDGVVALIKVLTNTVEGMTDVSALDTLPIDQLPSDMQPALQTMIADMKLMLDPAREPNILRPLQKAMHCVDVEDPSSELVRMVFRLGLEDHLPAFGIHDLLALVDQVLKDDPRGTLLHLVQTLVTSLRQDDQAMTSAAKVCETLFSNDVQPGDTQSPAQMALPVIDQLATTGVVDEAVCAADTLLYGCAGGAQPACTPVQ